MSSEHTPLFLSPENLSDILSRAESIIAKETHESVRVKPTEDVVNIINYIASEPAYYGYVYGNNTASDMISINSIAAERISKLYIAPDEAGQYWLGNRFDDVTRTGKKEPVAGMVAAANNVVARRRHRQLVESVKERQAIYSTVSDKFALGQPKPTDQWKLRDFQ